MMRSSMKMAIRREIETDDSLPQFDDDVDWYRALESMGMNASTRKILSLYRSEGKTSLSLEDIAGHTELSELNLNAGLAHLRDDGFVLETSQFGNLVTLTNKGMRFVAG